ncbi:MAG TPA: dihydrofolate reductase family protein [Chitinophagaceae bacterium]|jgi:dihydrofolate reductase|nr:dihydrofolate reductase family protein [Chitinophagaceae bacterium]
MRKIILQLAVSLDSFIEGPNGEFDWCFTDQDYGMSAFLDRVDTIFTGRKTYELLLGLGEHGKAAFPPLKYYVFSRTLSGVEKGDCLVKGDIEKEIFNIKNSPGKDIWLFGGANLTSSLMQLGLVDEIALAVHPVLLGEGKPLFTALPGRINLQFTGSKVYSTGLVFLTYRVLYN